jgi:DNA-binding LacI/PurR family transcriptional regulator
MMRTNVDLLGFGETFFMGLSEGVQAALAPHGLDLMILPCSTGEDQDAYLRRAVERHVADGFIISDIQRVDRRIDYLIDRRIPFVALGRSLSGGSHAWMDLDYEGVAKASVTRLVANGHRRIALGTITREVNNRYIFEEAFRAAHAAHAMAHDPSLILRAPNSEAGGYDIGQAILSMPDRPTAIVLAQETLAIGLYRSMTDAGVRIGPDLSVIGFRQNPACRFLSPSLTCFGLSLRQLGMQLGAALLCEIERSASTRSGERVQDLWPMSIVEGQSVCRADAAPR